MLAERVSFLCTKRVPKTKSLRFPGRAVSAYQIGLSFGMTSVFVVVDDPPPPNPTPLRHGSVVSTFMCTLVCVVSEEEINFSFPCSDCCLRR